MRFSVWPLPSQPFSEVLALAQHAATTGWDGVWFADHFMPNTEDAAGDTLECWAVVAALAAQVPRLTIGTLVCGNTYRHPAVLANQAAAVDVISGGRLVLGVGAGWQENEHHRYGIPFHTVRERLARLEEACQVIKALTGQERATFAGTYYTLHDAPLEPRPIQDPLPLLVGGGGEKVTLRIAATYADAWNVWGTPETLAHKIDVLERHCDAVGRDPAEIARSAQTIVVLSDDPAEVERARSRMPAAPLLAGNADQVGEAMLRYAEVGVDEFIVPDVNLGTGEQRLAMYDRLRDEVVAHVR